MKTLKLELVEHTVPKQEKHNSHVEVVKFCYDIVIDNMRWSGAWHVGGEKEQNEILEKIKAGISNIKIERILT